MVVTQTEAQRLTSIDVTTQLGRLADGVVVAALRWEQNQSIGDEDRAAVSEVAAWIEGIASAIADPLDLAQSLPQLGTLDVLGRFGQSGSGIGVLLSDTEDQSSAETKTSADIDSAQLLKIAELLKRFSNGATNEAEVRLLRQVFEKLAKIMLNSAESMLHPRTGATWTQKSDF